MQNSTNMRILELLRFLYERTDENHPATVSDIIAHLNGKGIQAVRQTVYADTNALIDAGIDIVVVKSTQNQYFMWMGLPPCRFKISTPLSILSDMKS